MKRLALVSLLVLSLMGCGKDVSSGKWIIEGEMYRYEDNTTMIPVMMKDFTQKYGKEYRIISTDFVVGVLVVERRK